MCTAPKTGKSYYCPRSSASSNAGKKWVRADAAFAKPEIYEALEERGVSYAIGIPARGAGGRHKTRNRASKCLQALR
jgi:hypothetical protein